MIDDYNQNIAIETPPHSRTKGVGNCAKLRRRRKSLDIRGLSDHLILFRSFVFVKYNSAVKIYFFFIFSM